MTSDRASQPLFLGVSALLFAGSATATVVWCRSMSAMGGMPMPGGWTMSMAWMRMPDQTWSGAAASFMLMWTVMMVAMMLPSLVPMLLRYREAIGVAPVLDLAAQGTDQDSASPVDTPATRLGLRDAVGRSATIALLMTIASVGYFLVWTLFGLAAYPAGVALAELEMRHPALSRAVPTAIAIVVLIVGALQFSPWKQRALSCCRDEAEPTPTPAPAPNDGRSRKARRPTGAPSAFRHGLRLGLDCLRCCGTLMTLVLVLGVMDLLVMTVVTIAITAERLAPSSMRAAHAIGLVIIATGVLLLARAAGLA